MIAVAPIVVALTLFVWICLGLVYVSGLVLGLISMILALLGVAVLITYSPQNGLIIGGIILDKMGVRFTGMGACLLMVLGCGHCRFAGAEEIYPGKCRYTEDGYGDICSDDFCGYLHCGCPVILPGACVEYDCRTF